MDLKDKVALVTGSAHRLGRDIALALAQEGCHLMVHYHQAQKNAEATCTTLRELGIRASSIQADLSQYGGIEQLFRAVDTNFGRLDILINSAAILESGHLLEVQEEDWNRTIDLNLKAVFFCLQFAAQRMLSQGKGCIINIADVIGHQPWEQFPVHSISKHGVEMVTKLAARSLAPKIRVNAIVPGLIKKPDEMDEGRWNNLAKNSPLLRSGTPEELVDSILFMIRNEYMTGEIMVLDGGLSLT